MKLRRTAFICLSSLCLLAATLAGCGGREGSICDKLITCEGGNDADRSACVNSYVRQTQVYSSYKCGESWSKYLECLDASALCNSGRLQSNNCSDNRTAALACVNAASAYGFKF